MCAITHQYILVGIETDPTRYHGENPGRPSLLESAATEQIMAHLATDLTALLPEISCCTLTVAGALFDQTQLLSPGLLVYQALETLQQTSNPGADFQPRLLSVGVHKGQMPLDELQPYEHIPLGLLQVLPMLVGARTIIGPPVERFKVAVYRTVTPFKAQARGGCDLQYLIRRMNGGVN